MMARPFDLEAKIAHENGCQCTPFFFLICNGLRDSDLSYNKEDAVATIWLGYPWLLEVTP